MTAVTNRHGIGTIPAVQGVTTRRRLPHPLDRPWLTVAEVAEITGEGQKAIRAALDAGQLPLLRVGRYVRVPTQRLYDLLGMSAEARPPSGGAAA